MEERKKQISLLTVSKWSFLSGVENSEDIIWKGSAFMKRCLCILACVLLLVGMCGSLLSCGSKNSADWLELDEKYIIQGTNNDTYFIFYSDHTGIFERHYSYASSVDASYSYTLSGTVSFEWRVGSDGAIYLFQTDVQYHEGHTEGKGISVGTSPIFGSEDFIVVESSNQNGINYTRYIREGSKLEKALKQD